MVEIKWTREAQVWLRDIYDYIAVDNRDAAWRTVDGIFQKAQSLKRHPKMGYRYEAEESREVRILLYGHYRIAYLVKSETTIEIIGVFHNALNIERYLV